MTTAATHTGNTTAPEPDTTAGLDLQDGIAVPGTDLVLAPPLAIGEIVDGPVRLNTGDQPQPLPFRAGVLDVRYLLDPQPFSRTNLGDLNELTASIIERRGVKVPLLVRAVGYWPGTEIEQFEIIKGKRRKYAAIAAELFDVPCWIVNGIDDVELILDILETNSYHKDLEPIEEAGAYQMMLDLGWSEQQIADARRLTAEQIRTAVKARALPAPARHALNQGTLTSDQVQALEEFEDSPEERQKLLDELGDEWRFKQALARLRDKRAYAKNKELARAHLVLDGVDVTSKPRGFGYEGTATPADQLLDGDGNPVDVEQVKTLPGFHGFVEKDGPQARTVVYCDDPAERGYTRKPTTSSAHRGMSADEITAQQQRDQQEAERIERLKLSATVRREFLVATYGSARTAKTLFVAALRSATLGKSLGRSAELNDLYQALGGSDQDALAGAGEDRLRRSLVAKYICHQEYNLNAVLDRYGYWLNESEATAWYDELRARQYPLTDDEQAVYQELSAADDENDEQDDERDDDERDDNEQDEDQRNDDHVTAADDHQEDDEQDDAEPHDDDILNAAVIGNIRADDAIDDLPRDDEVPLAA